MFTTDTQEKFGKILNKTIYVINKNKYYNKNKESSYLIYWDAKHLYRWVMSQKLPVDSFKWEEIIPSFNETFIKNYY